MTPNDQKHAETAHEYITKARMALAQIQGEMPDPVKLAVMRTAAHLKEAQSDLKLAIIHNVAPCGISGGRGK